MKEMESFIKDLSENVFTDTPVESLNNKIEYMELEEWTSMTAFTLISYIERAYGKKLLLPELLMAQTIEDLFYTVNS
jgi:acyl carrier protein